mmetsp:Transcript_8140/g.20385  ORF Transcript_8140/g.20385 Transcript_8140/m.20385 type:complete len:420 (+) Transcript_8140:637-1896(+)
MCHSAVEDACQISQQEPLICSFPGQHFVFGKFEPFNLLPEALEQFLPPRQKALLHQGAPCEVQAVEKVDADFDLDVVKGDVFSRPPTEHLEGLILAVTLGHHLGLEDGRKHGPVQSTPHHLYNIRVLARQLVLRSRENSNPRKVDVAVAPHVDLQPLAIVLPFRRPPGLGLPFLDDCEHSLEGISLTCQHGSYAGAHLQTPAVSAGTAFHQPVNEAVEVGLVRKPQPQRLLPTRHARRRCRWRFRALGLRSLIDFLGLRPSQCAEQRSIQHADAEALAEKHADDVPHVMRLRTLEEARNDPRLLLTRSRTGDTTQFQKSVEELANREWLRVSACAATQRVHSTLVQAIEDAMQSLGWVLLAASRIAALIAALMHHLLDQLCRGRHVKDHAVRAEVLPEDAPPAIAHRARAWIFGCRKMV